MGLDLVAKLMTGCKPDGLNLDIGANVGGHTKLMLERSGIVHCFEPCPKLAQGLRERYRIEPRVTVFQQGVSDRCYTETGLTVYEAWTLGKVGKPNKRGLSLGALEQVGTAPFDVQFTTVDEHVHGAMRVDFIKLDTDGYELRVLRGADKTIRSFRPTILIELGYLVDDIGDSIPDMIRLIHDDLGYRIYDGNGQLCDYPDWQKWYPFNTTADFAMVPIERNFSSNQ